MCTANADDASSCPRDIDFEILRDRPYQNGDWRSIRKRSDIYRHFVTEFVNIRENENRDCKKWDNVLQFSGNTSNMRNHYQNCINKTTTVLPTGQQTLCYATDSF